MYNIFREPVLGVLDVVIQPHSWIGDANSMNKSAKMIPRHDLLYLRCIAKESIRLQTGRNPEDRFTLSILRDYLSWLTVEAMTDEGLARRLVHTLAALQEELGAAVEADHARNLDPTAPAFYEGFLHGLEQAISFRYGVDLLLDEEIDRGEFLKSWERTRERLGL